MYTTQQLSAAVPLDSRGLPFCVLEGPAKSTINIPRREVGAMQVIAFMNMKGGVGKTTLAVNIAYALADLRKNNVLLIDCDPQFNATQCLVKTDAYLKHIGEHIEGDSERYFHPSFKRSSQYADRNFQAT